MKGKAKRASRKKAEPDVDPRLGFEVPFPMADQTPGVVDIVRIHAQYAAQMSVYESFAGEASADGLTETNTTNVVLTK